MKKFRHIERRFIDSNINKIDHIEINKTYRINKIYREIAEDLEKI